MVKTYIVYMVFCYAPTKLLATAAEQKGPRSDFLWVCRLICIIAVRILHGPYQAKTCLQTRAKCTDLDSMHMGSLTNVLNLSKVTVSAVL